MTKFKITPATKLPPKHAHFTAFTTAKHRENAKRTQAAQVAALRKAQTRKLDAMLRTQANEVTL